MLVCSQNSPLKKQIKASYDVQDKIKELKEWWPHHVWLKLNKIDCSKYPGEIHF